MTQTVILLSLWKGLIAVPAHTYTVPPSVRDAVLDEVREQTGVEPSDVLSGRRYRRIARARQLAMWLLRQHRLPCGAPRYSLPQIARAVGLKNHTSSWHGVRAHAARLAVAA